MNKKITVIGGDGNGAEIIQQAVKVLEAIAAEFKHKFSINRPLTGAEAVKKVGVPLPQATIDAALKSDAVLVGIHSQGQETLQQLKATLNAYVHFRPVTAVKALSHLSPLKPKLLEKVDLVLVREPDEITVEGSSEVNRTNALEKRVQFAFKLAMQRRKQLCFVVNDAQEIEKSVLLAMAKQYPAVKVEIMQVENALPALILNPVPFDIILSNRVTGRLLEGQSVLLSGAQGISAAGSMGNETGYYEPIPLSNPPVAGKDTANPIGSILSVALMLDQFGLSAEAGLVRDAAMWTINNGFVTKDIDSTNFYYTSTIGDLVSEFILGKIPDSVNHANIEITKSTII